MKPVDVIDGDIAVLGAPGCRMLDVCKPSAMELVVESFLRKARSARPAIRWHFSFFSYVHTPVK